MHAHTAVPLLLVLTLLLLLLPLLHAVTSHRCVNLKAAYGQQLSSYTCKQCANRKGDRYQFEPGMEGAADVCVLKLYTILIKLHYYYRVVFTAATPSTVLRGPHAHQLVV
jgi:hypothetical protein